jgi:hypothetical protein
MRYDRETVYKVYREAARRLVPCYKRVTGDRPTVTYLDWRDPKVVYRGGESLGLAGKNWMKGKSKNIRDLIGREKNQDNACLK